MSKTTKSILKVLIFIGVETAFLLFGKFFSAIFKGDTVTIYSIPLGAADRFMFILIALAGVGAACAAIETFNKNCH